MSGLPARNGTALHGAAMGPMGDNRALSPKRRKEREPSEVAGAVRRMLAALVARAVAGDLVALEELAAIAGEADVAVSLAMAGAHSGPAAYSWTEIAGALNVTRQAARQRGSKRR